VAAISVADGGTSAEGARIEAPRGVGVGCVEGVSPFPTEKGPEEGALPLPRKFFDF